MNVLTIYGQGIPPVHDPAYGLDAPPGEHDEHDKWSNKFDGKFPDDAYVHSRIGRVKKSVRIYILRVARASMKEPQSASFDH